MAKIKQFRYYGKNSTENYPAGLTASDLTSGTIFQQYTPIVQLGIQCLPGTMCRIGGNENPVIIGSTGIYDINIPDMKIEGLDFMEESINRLEETSGAYLIIDILYEGSGE